MSTARQVPFENEVFVGGRPQDTHGENADEQLANLQKRIWLIEFLRLGLIIVYQGNGGPAKIDKTDFWGRFFVDFPILSRVRKLGGKIYTYFTHLRTFYFD